MRYVFRCKLCAPKKEMEFDMDHDDKPPRCPECNRRMTKIMQNCGIAYKGDGWTGAQKDF